MSHCVPSNFAILNVSNSSLLLDQSQASTLCTPVYDQFLYGSYNLESFTIPEKRAFIEYGFARHREGQTIIDEPLAILASIEWLDNQEEFSMFKHLHQNIRSHAPRKNGFEAYLTFYLRKVFETTPTLDTVFTLRKGFARRKDLSWQHENFELVTVFTTDDEHRSQVEVIMPSSGPSPALGFSARSNEDVLDWISTNRDRCAFCFPPESFGPDILCFVRSKKSRKLLLVLIQAKFCKRFNKKELIKGIRTVTPSWFWRRKGLKVCSFLQTVWICFV